MTRIRALGQSWLAAVERRDIDGMMVIYAPDAQELLPGIPLLAGRDVIRTFYQDLIERFPRLAHQFTPQAITVASSGDLAVVRGTYRFTPDPLMPERAHEGKYISVWQQREGEWCLFINISNDDHGPPEAQ